MGDILDDLMRAREAEAYNRAVREWEQRLTEEERAFDARLRDPAENRVLGLPEVLPEHTIAILRRTQALDKIGPSRPTRGRPRASA